MKHFMLEFERFLLLLFEGLSLAGDLRFGVFLMLKAIICV